MTLGTEYFFEIARPTTGQIVSAATQARRDILLLNLSSIRKLSCGGLFRRKFRKAESNAHGIKIEKVREN